MGLAKELVDKAAELLNIRAKIEKTFFDVSGTMTLLRAGASKSIQSILNESKSNIITMISSLSGEQIAAMGLDLLAVEFSDDNVANYAKVNKNVREVDNHVKNQINEDMASEITLACFNGDYDNEKLQRLENAISIVPLDPNNYFNIAGAESDFENKINNRTTYNGLENLYNEFQSIIPAALLVYNLLLKIKDYLGNSRFPSQFRTGYLQKQLRQLGLLLKKSARGLKSQVSGELESIIKGFSAVDALILGVSTAAFIYLRNREKGQEISTKELEKISVEATCEPFEPNFDVSISPTPVGDFSCPVLDEAIVPHKPIEISINDFDCDIEFPDEDLNISADPESDVASKGIIQNLSPSEGFEIYVHVDQKIEAETTLGKIGDTLIYSSVSGYVFKIDPNIIWLRDISDIGNNLFEQATNDLKTLYEELNEIKRFTKDFYLSSWYPPMLASTPFIDPSLNTNPTISKIGIGESWNSINNAGNKEIEIFDKNIKEVTNQDNIKTKAENNNLEDISNEFNKLENLMFKNLNLYADRGIGIAKLTRVKKKDLIYFDYLLSLIGKLNSYDDQNKTVIEFSLTLSNFLLERYFIEGHNLNDLISKIDNNCNDLDGTKLFERKQNYYENLTNIFNDHTEKEPIKSVEDYLVELGKSRNKLNQGEEAVIVDNTLQLFKFSRIILDLQNNNSEYKPKSNINELSFKEGNFIKNYFGQIKSRIEEIPKEIIDLEKKIDDLGISFVPPSIIRVDDEDYEWYGIKGPERTCPLPEEENGYLSANTEFDLGTIQYWLKYCSFATLASVANPGRGWSTGIPPPTGPIQLPVVYIPFKSFMTKWGFIVVGLTICGYYPFPWVLFGNMSTNYNTPFGDPASFIKKQINELKKTLSAQLKNFKQKILGDYLERQRIKVIGKNEDIDRITLQKREHRVAKPEKDRTKNTVNDKLAYANELASWAQTQATYEAELLASKTERFVEETKYKIVYDAYTDVDTIKGAGIDTTLESMQKGEEALAASLDSLNKLVDKINNVLIPLPISMKPNTANFGITAKNPKPIIKIKDNVAPEVQVNAVQKIIDKFGLKAEDFMSSKFEDKANSSISGNFQKYKSALSVAKFTLVPSDPFPKYENLKPTNIAWIPFLYNNFTVVGAKTFGIPGQLPIPI